MTEYEEYLVSLAEAAELDALFEDPKYANANEYEEDLRFREDEI